MQVPSRGGEPDDAQQMIKVVSAVVSRMISTGLLYPVERVFLVLETQHVHPAVLENRVYRYDGLIDALGRMLEEQGASALYKGSCFAWLTHVCRQLCNDLLAPPVKRRLAASSVANVLGSSAASLGAGSLSAALTHLIMSPLQHVQLRLTADGFGGTGLQFEGALDVVSKTYHNGGVLAFFRGMDVSFVGSLANRFCYYFFMNLIGGQKPFTAGLVSLLAGVATYPLTQIGRRLILESDQPPGKRKYHSSWQCGKRIVQEEGAGALWQGSGLQLAKGFLLLCVMQGVTTAASYIRKK